MNEKLKMNNSPHISSSAKTQRIMLDVIIAMIPAILCGVIFFGLYSLVIVCITVATCVFSEFIFNKIRKKPNTINDLSSIVTGIILGLNMPPTVPLYIPIIGGMFAIILVKMLFGGLGKNFANPAATARVFLVLAYASMTKFVVPTIMHPNFTVIGALETGSTYLGAGMAATTLSKEFLGLTGLKALNLQLFLGGVGGCIGETSALAILIGGVYLVIRRVIDLRITLTMLLSCAFFALIFSGSVNNILPQILSGGIMFASVFMATDYATSPKSSTNRIIYALGIGFMTMLIRFFGAYPEGVSIAIVFMNLLAPLLDKYIVPVRFGEPRKQIAKYVSLALCGVMLLSVIVLAPITIGRYEAPYSMAKVDYSNSSILGVNKISGGYEITVKGFVNSEDKSETDWKNGSVTLKIKCVDQKIKGVSFVSSKMTDLPNGKSDLAMQQEFLNQFIGEIAVEFNISTGATTKSTIKAVNNAVNGASKWYKEKVGGAK